MKFFLILSICPTQYAHISIPQSALCFMTETEKAATLRSASKVENDLSFHANERT